jgi:hypothetical protein
VIRPSGLYAVVGGEQIQVESHGRDFVRLPGTGSARTGMDDLDDFVSVKTDAVWRGGKVSVSAVVGDGCGFDTSDQRLAERESLAGDFYNGWHGSAPLAELTDVDERVTSIHPRRREA